MAFLRKRWKVGVALLAVFIATLLFGISAWAGSQIASPPRRALMDYHREYLEQPAKHGLSIDRFVASDGTPCLVCTPAETLGDRGIKIRQQLADRGVMPGAPGKIGTLVLLHGRKGRKEDYLPIAERLCAVGFRCVIPDLPAHGENPTPVTTYGVREAAMPARVLNEAAERYHFDKSPAGLIGMSMGGAVAGHAASLPDAPWKALVIISSFDALQSAIDCQTDRYCGSWLGGLLCKGASLAFEHKTGIALASIRTEPCVSQLRIPTLIAHGDNDHAIPLSSGRRLFDALPETTEKRWTIIPGADHDNVLVTSYPIYADIAEWMLVHVGNR